MKILDREAVIQRIAEWKAERIDLEEALKYDGVLALNVLDNDLLAAMLEDMRDVRKELAEEGAIIPTPAEEMAEKLKKRLEDGDDWDPQLYGALKSFLDEGDNLEEQVEGLLTSIDGDTAANIQLKNTLEEWLAW